MDNNEGEHMIVIAALNGTLTSETAAHYALRYCSVYRFDLHLLHVRNEADPIESIMQSMENIEMEASRLDSFSDKVTRMRMGCDVAVVRIANLESAGRHSSLMLSIRDARLSAQKFVFFASLDHQYDVWSIVNGVLRVGKDSEPEPASVGKNKNTELNSVSVLRAVQDWISEKQDPLAYLAALQMILNARHIATDNQKTEFTNKWTLMPRAA
jgi:hypothetical protein